MLEINLLDWREKERIINNNRFYVITGVFSGVCVVLAMIFYLIIGVFISAQQEKISFLNSQIIGVESKITELNDLQEQKKLLIERQEVVESLQTSRPFVVELFNAIPNVVPDGIVLTEMSRKDNELVLTGSSDSNSDVAKLMDNIQKLKWVQEAKLGEIKSANGKSGAMGNTAMSQSTRSKTNANATDVTAVNPNEINFELHVILNPDYTGG